MLYTRNPEEPSCATRVRHQRQGRILAPAHRGYRCVFTEHIQPNTERDRVPEYCARGRRRREPGGKGRKMHRETGMAEVNGARIYYEVAGEGEPLVLVHAGIADSRMWEGQFKAFAERYRVIRHDMRGFGRTALVDGAYSHHEDLRTLLDKLKVERAHLVGCSMGGGAVLDFALEYPQRVGNLVLVGSAVGGFGPDIDPPRQWDEILAAEQAGDLEL